jgi:hypothetical protein
MTGSGRAVTHGPSGATMRRVPDGGATDIRAVHRRPHRTEGTGVHR